MDKLIATLAAKFPELTESDVQLSVETIINAMSAQLIRGGRIELRGFGTFRLNEQLPANRSNSMGELNCLEQEVPTVIFKPGLVIRERINNISYHDHDHLAEQLRYINV
jgi:integration host factor subunit beta